MKVTLERIISRGTRISVVIRDTNYASRTSSTTLLQDWTSRFYPDLCTFSVEWVGDKIMRQASPPTVLTFENNFMQIMVMKTTHIIATYREHNEESHLSDSLCKLCTPLEYIFRKK